jgi:hypothetical protein
MFSIYGLSLYKTFDSPRALFLLPLFLLDSGADKKRGGRGEEKMIGEEDREGARKGDNLGLSSGKLADAGREGRIIELIVSVQQAGNERGKRIYFDSKSMEEIREKCGDDFFLFDGRTLLAFVDPAGGRITLTSLKGIYKNFL